jgi:hypothetical protein
VTAAWQSPDPLAHLPARVPHERAQFRRDVAWAWGVCRRHPLLTTLSLVIGLAPLLYSVGQHRTMHDGLVTTAPPGPVHQLLALLGGAAGHAQHSQRLADGTVATPAPTWRLLLLIAVMTIVVDVACTFVTPAIVFTSHRVRDALTIGLRVLRASWPSTAPYALIPPLAVVAFTLYSGLSPALAVPLVAASTLLNLIVKGATAAYYLRVVPTPWADGALAVHPRYPPTPGDRGDRSHNANQRVVADP